CPSTTGACSRRSANPRSSARRPPRRRSTPRPPTSIPSSPADDGRLPLHAIGARAAAPLVAARRQRAREGAGAPGGQLAAGRELAPRALIAPWRVRLAGGSVPYLFIAPKLLFFALFMLLPLLWTILMTFQSGAILKGPKFVGLQNYATIVHDELFWI